MKKITLISFIIILTLTGCTKLPASQETGVRPGEYEGIKNTEAIKTENESLKKELEDTKNKLGKIEGDYLNLARNNDITIKKLHEAESLLNLYDNNKLPKFTLEQTDIRSIMDYINEKKNILDEKYALIKSIPLEKSGDKIIFYTVGYGKSYNQIYIWMSGNAGPQLIDDGDFNENGTYSWLVQDKYLLINKGTDNTVKILDIEAMKIISSFKTNSNIYLFPGTSNILIQKLTSSNSGFIIYNFVANTEQELDLDFKYKYTDFKVDGDKNAIIFSGTYLDEYETEYSVNATVNIDNIKKIYKSNSLEVESEGNETDTKIQENIQGITN